MARWLMYCTILLLSIHYSLNGMFDAVLKIFVRGLKKERAPTLAQLWWRSSAQTDEINDSVEHEPAWFSDPRAKADFDNKLADFRHQLTRHEPETAFVFYVARANAFEDSFAELNMPGTNGVTIWKRNRFVVKFLGENVGGLPTTRDWYTLVTKEISNPERILLTPAADRASYTINPGCPRDPIHGDYFRFIGRIIGKLVSLGRQTPYSFSRSVYKHLLNKPVDCEDTQLDDPQLYITYGYMKSKSVAELRAVFDEDLTFSFEVPGPSGMVVEELIDNGANILVTDENKDEYLRHLCRLKLIGATPHNEAFRRGFHDIIQPTWLADFNEQELEFLISGLRKIDIEDLKSNTYYKGFSQSPFSHSEIKWFWQALGEFNPTHLATFLQFVTGLSKPPLDGFASLTTPGGTSQKFTIRRVQGVDLIPVAHNCDNHLDLSKYTSYEELRQKLLLGMRLGTTEGFHNEDF